MPGAETLGGGNPEWKVSADQAPVSPGYIPDASKIVGQGSATDWSADAVLINGVLQPFDHPPVSVENGQHAASARPVGEFGTLRAAGGGIVDSGSAEVGGESPLDDIVRAIHNRN